MKYLLYIFIYFLLNTLSLWTFNTLYFLIFSQVDFCTKLFISCRLAESSSLRYPGTHTSVALQSSTQTEFRDWSSFHLSRCGAIPTWQTRNEQKLALGLIRVSLVRPHSELWAHSVSDERSGSYSALTHFKSPGFRPIEGYNLCAISLWFVKT